MFTSLPEHVHLLTYKRSSYHVGAGLSDVVFSTTHNASTDRMRGFLNSTNVTANGMQFYNAYGEFPKHQSLH